MNRAVTLEQLFIHPITQKYLNRSGMDHAITVAEKAFEIAAARSIDPDLAAKAGLLHDIGHYEWYRKNGEWDFETYRKYDIHPIKGAARAHKLLIRCHEDPFRAKEIALAILFHTDSYLPGGKLDLSPLQQVVALADRADEEPGGRHHYRKISYEEALKRIRILDEKIDLMVSMNQCTG
jgi:uncharacterized domain HDIG